MKEIAAQIFPGALGLWLALAMIKLGNPVILKDQVGTPAGWLESLYQPWPIEWSYPFLAAAVVCGIPLRGWKIAAPRALAALPAIWFAWQCLAARHSLRPDLTAAILPHFLICIVAFYLGLFVASRVRRPRALWLALAGGWLVVVAIGWRQHFGGLAETREFFYSLADWRNQPPELIAKIASNRIYSTLVYPNALAGSMLLMTPPLVFGAWVASRQERWGVRLLWMAPVLVGSLGCLIWSGSKAGWLIALALVAITIIWGVTRPKLRIVWIGILAVGGIGGFWYRYGDYVAKGASSASARMDYWNVAWSNACARPMLGTGPGSFLEVYRLAKPPKAEMTRMVHNDYLQQATDSGVVGGLLLAGFVAGSLIWAAGSGRLANPFRFGIWLGATGLALQCLVEFGLYIPALAWPWFAGLGAILGCSQVLESPGAKTVDNLRRIP